MYCNRCGTLNPDDAVYCKKCGGAVEPEEETRIAPKQRAAEVLPARSNAEPDQVFSIAPTLKFVYAGYALTVVVAFLLLVLLTIFVPGFAPVVGVVVGVALLLVPAYYHLRQRLVRYSLSNATIEIDRGLVSRTRQNIPLRRVQDVTVSATLVQRMLGYGDITIDNASEDGGKVVLDNVDSPRRYADLILRRMHELER
jgi:uncharacterized membrane protein YdbT with pleckstrin-like domain